MSLVDRLTGRKQPAAPKPSTPESAPVIESPEPPQNGQSPAASVSPTSTFSRFTDEVQALSAVDQLKVDIHHRLISRLDLEALEKIQDEQEVTTQIRRAVTEVLRGESTPLSQAEREEIVEHIVWEIIGLGPIEPLFRDKTITDILVNNAHNIFVERRGKLTRINAAFRNDAHLMAVIDRIVARVGRRIDESSPMVDARLPDGSRVNAIIPPLALDGPILSIRRFGTDPLTMRDLVQFQTIPAEIAEVLALCIKARLNVLIS